MWEGERVHSKEVEKNRLLQSRKGYLNAHRHTYTHKVEVHLAKTKGLLDTHTHTHTRIHTHTLNEDIPVRSPQRCITQAKLGIVLQREAVERHNVGRVVVDVPRCCAGRKSNLCSLQMTDR